MKIKELVAKLEKLDQEATIYLADGYWMSTRELREDDVEFHATVPYTEYGTNGYVIKT